MSLPSSWPSALRWLRFAWLNHINPPFPVTDDGVRDQLLVRDCTELGRCHLIGAPASLSGFHQGAAWLDLLIAVDLLGGDTSTERMVVLAFLAAGVATLFVVVWRWLSPAIAFPAALLLVGGLSLNIQPSLLVNASVAAFPDVLTAAGLLCYGLSGRRRFLIASSCALGIAVNVHVGALSLVPPLLAIAVLARPRPWRELLASVGVLSGTYLATSSAALRANVIGLAEHGRLMPALAGGLAVVVLSWGLGSRFRGLSWNARAWVIGVLLILPFGLASLWLVLWQGHDYTVAYLHPILAPAAALAAAALCLPFELGARWIRVLRWVPTTVSVAAIAFVGLQLWKPAAAARAEPWSSWSPADARAIADRAARRGWSYEDLVFRLQGVACRELLIGMSMVAPPPAAASRHGHRQVQVVRVGGRALPALMDPGDVVRLGSSAAVVREVESWLRPESLRACRVRIGSGRDPVCSPAAPLPSGGLDPQRFLFATRAYPGIHDLDLPPPYVATYEIPLSSVAGESRELALTDDAAPGCGWRITRVEGVRVEGALPARRVRLRSDTGGPGSLVIEKPFGTAECNPADIDRRYPPCLLETALGDPLQSFAEIR